MFLTKLLRLGIKNKHICFVLLSTFRNFALKNFSPERSKHADMKKSCIFLSLILLCVCLPVGAQRFTDLLGRGLVAVQTGSTSGSTTNLVTWRRLADEYYDVTYNLYKDGALLASGLTTTCYADNNRGYASTQYQVAAVVRGVEQSKCAAITPWTQYVYSIGGGRYPTGYLDIDLATVYDRDGNDVTAHYQNNDAEVADLDGDGELEIIIKRVNTFDAGTDDGNGGTKDMYAYDSREFSVFDAYDVNWQTGAATLMWRIDCGPNMVSLSSTELNLVAYDWDEDGRAEVALRGADDMRVIDGDGSTLLYTIGTAGTNKRDQMGSHSNSQYAWTHRGNEYLIYLNGATGSLYQSMTYPLKRFESDETVSSKGEEAAWGDNYGHRSSKYFMGAPFLDGRRASLFLARGIYTRHKMVALDLNRSTHQWSERWRWNCNDPSSDWYGQGYHNFIIADVDEDGRDEIVYGSMVIDDNGRGLSTTGYGHGDAQHVGDFDPYTKGLEFFGCLEEGPVYGSNYRNATTGEVRYKFTNGSDDGRAMMGNFSNAYPGCLGRSVGSGLISSVTDAQVIDRATADAADGDALYWSHLNFRIYWDGDLRDEILDSPGTEREAAVYDYESGRLFTSVDCNMNNNSKNNPCFQGDIIGDWREEIIVRRGSGLRVYTSGIGTDYSMPSLWFDHQYRQAMVWQMHAYNQPPHLSYFLGELEGITSAPPPLTNRGRTEVANGGTIATTTNHLLLAETNNMTVTVTDGAAPYMLTVNTPSWVQGNDNNASIATTYYTHTLTGGALTGTMRLAKQGDGTLVMPSASHTYTGGTNVWGGTLRLDNGSLAGTLWLNRHTTLQSAGSTFTGDAYAEYGSTITPGGNGTQGTLSMGSLTLKAGARLRLDVFENFTADQLSTPSLTLSTLSGEPWDTYGPHYLKPVIEVVQHGTLGDGRYDLGTISLAAGSDLADLVLEGTEGLSRPRLQLIGGHLYLLVGSGGYAGDYTYFNDFENTVGTTATGSQGTEGYLDATIVGSGSFAEESSPYGTVFQNVGGSQRTNYLLLPADVLSHSAESHQLSIGFWVNKSSATSYDWAPLFTAYSAAPSASNTYPMLACQYRGVLQVNCNGWCDYVDEQNAAGSNTLYHGGDDWLADGDWHHYMVVFNEEEAKVYFDGVLKNQWDASQTYVKDESTMYTTQLGLFTNGSDLSYICLGGNQAWNWADDDPAFKFDDLYITNKALTPDDIERILFEKNPSALIASNRGDLTRYINGDFQTDAMGWTGGTWCNWVPERSWRGTGYSNSHYERTTDGTMSLTLPNMPAGTYKVVAAARSYVGGQIIPQLAGTNGNGLTGVGDSRTVALNTAKSREINLNGVEMPYNGTSSTYGGFTTNEWGHNWQWISATGTLATEGDLTINFNCTGTAWMAIDDVHLYCTRLSGTNYCASPGTLSGNYLFTNSGKVTTCDLVVTNPNIIVRSQWPVTTATGDQMNNNYINSGGLVMNRMVLYDGFDFNDYVEGGGYRITNGATLYRQMPAGQWCTLMVPFYPTNLDTRKVPSSLADGVLNFADAPGTNMNNEPMLVRTSGELTSVTGSRNGTYGTGYNDMEHGSGAPMRGTYTRITDLRAAAGDVAYTYVVSRKAGEDEDKLFLVNSVVGVSPFRAYFYVPNGVSAVKSETLRLNFDDITPVLSVSGVSGRASEVYDLAGRRLYHGVLRPGLYIVNGRKLHVRQQ